MSTQAPKSRRPKAMFARFYADLVKPPLDADNRCVQCKRIVVGLKPGDLHDHTEQCPDCGRERETPCV